MSGSPLEWMKQLCDTISIRSDLELLCSDGKSINVHSMKLALASPVLGELMDLMDDQIISEAKRQRMDELKQRAGGQRSPQLKVSTCILGSVPCMYPRLCPMHVSYPRLCPMHGGVIIDLDLDLDPLPLVSALRLTVSMWTGWRSCVSCTTVVWRQCVRVV